MASADDLRAAGFSDAEIGAHQADQTDTLRQAGFNDSEIAQHLGLPDPAKDKPLPPSKGLLDRLYDSAVAYGKGSPAVKDAVEGFGTEPVGLSPETTQQLRDLGLFNDPAKGQTSPIRFLNEAVMRPAATLADTAVRAINAGVHEVAGAIGFGVDKQSGGLLGDEDRIKREATNFLNYQLLTQPGHNPMTRVEHGPTGVVTDAHIGGLPALRDFDNAATVLRNPDAVPVLRQLYDERGVSPAEVLHDAQTDVTILQDVAEGKVPASYGGAKELPAPEEPGLPAEVSHDTGVNDGSLTPAEGGGAGGGEPPKGGDALPGRDEPLALPKPDEPMTVRDAQDAMLKKINVGDHDPKRPITFQSLYTAFIDDLNPVHETVKRALSETKGEGAGAVDPYQLFRLTRGVAGKADQFLLHGTYNALSFKVNGASLADVLAPLKEAVPEGELDLIDQFRAYTTAKRAIELSERRVGQIKEIEDAKAAVKDAKAERQKLDDMPAEGLTAAERRSINSAKAEWASEIEKRQAKVEKLKSAKMPDENPSGMPLEAAKAIVADKTQAARFESVHKAAVDYQNRLSMYLRDSGIVSNEAYAAMVEANKNYAPFYRWIAGEVLPDGKVARGTLSSRNPLKKIKGSDADIVDPVESMIKNTYTYIALAEKNMAGTALVDLMKQADEGGIWRVDMLPPEPKVAKTGTAVAMREEAPGAAKVGERPADAKLTNEQRRLTTDIIDGTAEDVTPTQAVTERDWPKGEAPKEDPLLIETDIIDGEYRVIDEEMAKAGISGPDAADLRATIRGLAREPKGDEIFIFRDGKREAYKVSDPELLAAWRGLDTQTTNTLTRILALPARTLRAGATIIPDFAAGNLLRDFQTAFVNTKGALFSPMETVRGGLGAIRKDESYQQWLMGGGANSAMVSLDRRYLQENLLRLGKDTRFLEGVWNVVTSPVQGLRMLSEFTETATRLGEFKKALREGEGDAVPGKEEIQAAAFRSREVTLDFARVGSQMRAYNMITAFANANIQGTDRLMRALHDAPMSTSLRIAAGVTAPSLLLYAFNRNDPVYQDLQAWQRDMFYIFPIHSWQDAKPTDDGVAAMPDYLKRTTEDGRFQIDKPTVVRIKKDFTTGVIFGSGFERAAEAFFNANPKAFDGFFKSVLDALSPSMIPTIGAPALEQFANKSMLTAAPLVPQSAEKLLPEYRYTQGTTELAKTLAKVIGAFPGMRDAATHDGSPVNFLASALTTPVLIEQYVRDWTGGLGVYAMQALDLSLRKAGALPDPVQPTSTLADIPFIKSFIARYPSASTQSVQDFYDRNKANGLYVDTLKAKAAEGDIEAVQRVQALGGDLVKLDGIQKAMATQERMVRMIYASPDLTPQEKRQNIDTLYFQIVQAAKAGVQMLDAIDEGSGGAKFRETGGGGLLQQMVNFFGGGEAGSSPAFGNAPYPSAEDAKAAEAAGFGRRQGVDKVTRAVDASRMRGDTDEMASRIAAAAPKDNPAAQEVFTRAALAANRSAISALGFEPSRVGLDNSGEKTNLAGFYDPSKDAIFAKSDDPSSVVHESLHRGIQQLREAGVLTAAEKGLLAREETVVRYLMATVMGDPEGSGGPVDKQQREHALASFKAFPSYKTTLDGIEAKAAQLYARKRPGGPT